MTPHPETPNTPPLAPELAPGFDRTHHPAGTLQTGTLDSLQTGKIQRHIMPDAVRTDFRSAVWTSGIFKSPVPSGNALVTPAGIEGDQQADLQNHGGPDNVVLAYDAAHYPIWRERLHMPDLPFGSFGENFTVSGFSDDTVCIGDIWQVGPLPSPPANSPNESSDAPQPLTLQITQPRQPCYKLARRLQQPHIVKFVHETSWGGWYLRVLNKGPAHVGMPIRLTARLHPDWPIATAVQTMYARNKLPEKAAALAQLPELSTRWKQELLEA